MLFLLCKHDDIMLACPEDLLGKTEQILKEALPHKRELKGSQHPKRVMRSLPDHHLQVQTLVSQASETLDCKDGACRDDRCTKSVANKVNTPESARQYRYPEFDGKRGQNWLLRTSTHSDELHTSARCFVASSRVAMVRL